MNINKFNTKNRPFSLVWIGPKSVGIMPIGGIGFIVTEKMGKNNVRIYTSLLAQTCAGIEWGTWNVCRLARNNSTDRTSRNPPASFGRNLLMLFGILQWHSPMYILDSSCRGNSLCSCNRCKRALTDDMGQWHPWKKRKGEIMALCCKCISLRCTGWHLALNRHESTEIGGK
jgi:hypothetical protein